MPFSKARLKRAIGWSLVSAVAGYFIYGQIPPVVHVPSRTLPTPNARDTFLKAEKEIVQKDDSRNFWLDVDEPSRSMQDRRLSTPAERRAYVDSNAKVLATVQQGLSQTYNADESHATLDTSVRPVPLFDLARFLVVAGKVSEEKGNLTAATDSYLDAVEMGTKMPEGSGVMSLYCAIAIQSIGRKPLLSCVEQMDSQTARHAAKRLENLERKKVPLPDILTEEKYYRQRWFAYAFDHPRSLVLYLVMSGGDTKIIDRAFQPGWQPAPHEMLYAQLQVAFWTKRGICTNYSRYIDAMTERSRLPYKADRPALPHPKDPFNACLFNSETEAVTSAILYDTRNQSQNALLVAMLALRAYHAEHGVYPTTLQELVAKGYLSHLPTDPFSETLVPLQYRQVKGKYLLYSIGLDGKDDNGTPCSKARKLDPEAKGDIVAGVNTY